MARHFSHRKVGTNENLLLHKLTTSCLFLSSGRRETPFLDARLRAQKYSANVNILNVTTVSPVSSSSSTMTERLTTASPKVYESGEDLNADALDDDDNETDGDDDDDVDEEQEADDVDDDSDVRDDFTVGKAKDSVFKGMLHGFFLEVFVLTFALKQLAT